MDAKESLIGTGPFISSGYISYLWVVGVSLWAGVVSFFEQPEAKFSMIKFMIHLSSAAFAGLLTFWICQYGNVPGPLIGVFCGIASHMGTPALLKLKIFQTLLEKAGADKKDVEKL
jgi:hypothetical protein